MPSLTDCLASWLTILETVSEGAVGMATETSEAWRFQAFCDDSSAYTPPVQASSSRVSLWLENAVAGRAWLALPLGVALLKEGSDSLVWEDSHSAQTKIERFPASHGTDAGRAAANPAHSAAEATVRELSLASELATCLSPTHAWWLPELRPAPSVPADVQRGWRHEQSVLLDSLLRARCVIAGDLVWLVVPCSLWTAAARVLNDDRSNASRGAPPSDVLEDWVMQWSRLQSQCPNPSPPSALPSLSATLLSQHGWLCSLSPLCESLASLLQLERAPQRIQAWFHREGIVPRIATWPTLPKSEQTVAPKLRDGRSALDSTPIAPDGELEPTETTPDAKASRANDSDPIETIEDAWSMSKPSQVRTKQPRKRLNSIRSTWIAGAVGGAGILASMAIAVWFWPPWTARTSDNLARSSSEKPRDTKPQPTALRPSSGEQASSGDALVSSGRSEARSTTADEVASPPEPGANAEELAAITSLDSFDDAAQRNKSPEVIVPSLTGLLADLDQRIAMELGPRAGVDRDTKTEHEAPTEGLSVELTTDSIVERAIAADTTELAANGMPPRAASGKTRFPADPLDTNPSPPGDQPAQGAIDAAPDAADEQSSLTHRIPLRLGVQRLDARVGKGVHAKLASAVARLQMAEEALPEVQMVPSDEVTLTGSAISEWRIAIEDAQPELIVRLSSRPNAKWPLAVQVGVQLSPLQDPMPLGPTDAANVLQNLALYRTWLERTIETLSNMPSPPRALGGPDRIALLRHYRAQWKETEKAIEAWQVVQRLSRELFQYATIEIRLQPQPATVETP